LRLRRRRLLAPSPNSPGKDGRAVLNPTRGRPDVPLEPPDRPRTIASPPRHPRRRTLRAPAPRRGRATAVIAAVEPDNVDGYANASGFLLTAAHQLAYNRFLPAAAHARDRSIGLKNDLAQVAALKPSFDFAINEQCCQYKECGGSSRS
jgi:hypothetical protein